MYNNTKLEIVISFVYLSIVFTLGGWFSMAQQTLLGQAQNEFTNLDLNIL